jgi:hypothetical protein
MTAFASDGEEQSRANKPDAAAAATLQAREENRSILEEECNRKSERDSGRKSCVPLTFLVVQK